MLGELLAPAKRLKSRGSDCPRRHTAAPRPSRVNRTPASRPRCAPAGREGAGGSAAIFGGEHLRQVPTAFFPRAPPSRGLPLPPSRPRVLIPPPRNPPQNHPQAAPAVPRRGSPLSAALSAPLLSPLRSSWCRAAPARPAARPPPAPGRMRPRPRPPPPPPPCAAPRTRAGCWACTAPRTPAARATATTCPTAPSPRPSTPRW